MSAPTTSRGRADYAERVEARREALTTAATSLAETADENFAQLRRIARNLQGEPIKVGHHSERGHRALHRKMDKHLERGAKAHQESERLAAAAARVGTAGISSDDPEALAKLQAELVVLVAKRDRMKATNAAWRKAKTREAREAIVIASVENERVRAAMRSIGQSMPFPSYKLTNIGANIRRIEGRIAELSGPAPSFDRVHGGWFVIEVRPELNRIVICPFRRMSAESFASLKSSGWRFSPKLGVFLRMLTATGVAAAKQAAVILSREGTT